MTQPPSGPRRDYDHLFKLVLIGDSGVGKSCILLRFADDQFTSSFITTIGVDFRFKTIPVDQKVVKLQIWDTAGQERFRTITSAYYRGADGIVICYDCTDRDSFSHVEEWNEEVKKYANVQNYCKILLANKSDVDPAERKVEPEEGEKKAKALGLSFMEISAKSGNNVEEAFALISSNLIKLRAQSLQQQQQGGQSQQQQGGGPPRGNIQLGGQTNQQRPNNAGGGGNGFNDCCG